MSGSVSRTASAKSPSQSRSNIDTLHFNHAGFPGALVRFDECVLIKVPYCRPIDFSARLVVAALRQG
jgi:hypothetical protein